MLQFSVLIWLRFCWVSLYFCICFSWYCLDTSETPMTLFKVFGGGRGRIQSNLVRIQLDLSFRVVFSRIWGASSRIWGVSSRIWGVSSWVRGVSSRMGAYPVGFEGKISIGALDIFNGGVKNPMGVLKRVNGGIENIRRGYCVGSMGALGAWRKGSMVALKRVNGALVRVSGGIEKGQGGIGQGQWGYWKGSMGSMGVLKRINGGIGQGQWGYWKGSMGSLVRVNGDIEKGQWGRWSGSMRAWRRVRSDRGLALGQTGVWHGVAVGQTGGCLTGL